MSRRKRGFTLVEVVLVVTLFGAVLGSIVAVVRSCTRACAVGSTAAHLEAIANRTLEDIEERLQASGAATVTPALATPFSSPQIDFQRTTGYAGGVAAWSPLERIGFALRPGETDDGIDEDGNGLVDDGRVVWTQDVGLASQRAIPWTDGVSEFLDGEALNNADDNANGLIDERGLCFTVEGASVFVRLTLEGRSANGVLLTKTVEKRVFFRNR